MTINIRRIYIKHLQPSYHMFIISVVFLFQLARTPLRQHSRPPDEVKPLVATRPGMTKIGDSSTDMASKEREVDDARGNDITSIGYFGYKPKWMQVFNNPKAFLFFMCCFAFLQGVYKYSHRAIA